MATVRGCNGAQLCIHGCMSECYTHAVPNGKKDFELLLNKNNQNNKANHMWMGTKSK